VVELVAGLIRSIIGMSMVLESMAARVVLVARLVDCTTAR